MKKQDCTGCYNNDYNYGLGGAKQCWSYDESKELVKRYIIHKDQMPPFNKTLIREVPPCYQPQYYCVVELDGITDEGYWK